MPTGEACRRIRVLDDHRSHARRSGAALRGEGATSTPRTVKTGVLTYLKAALRRGRYCRSSHAVVTPVTALARAEHASIVGAHRARRPTR
jgi:hypothetical protein